MRTKKILIISGCMAVQSRVKGNILEAELYHNILQNDILNSNNIKLETTILTYSDIKDCFKKIQEHGNQNDVDLILYQIRTMDFFILINYKKANKHSIDESNILINDVNLTKKLNFKYKNFKNKLKGRNSFIYQILKALKKNVLESPLLFLNICLILNKNRALNTYKNIVSEVCNYSEKNNIPILFLGVTSRPNSFIENETGRYLNNFMIRYFKSINKIYIDIFGKYDEAKNYKFVRGKKSSDKPNLNAIGHIDAAKKIKDYIINLTK